MAKTIENNALLRGWNFSAKLAGVDFVAQSAHSYVGRVSEAIAQMEKEINHHQYRGQNVTQFKGYVAEEWHGGTYNIGAVASGSTDRAKVLRSNDAGSIDIQLDSGKNYSAKVYSDGASSAVAQAAISPNTGAPKYEGQFRLIPEDQMEGARKELQKRALRNQEIRPNVAEAYSETEAKLTSYLDNDNGVRSIPKERKDYEEMARAGKTQEFRAENHGVTIDSAIIPEYMFKRALQAGYTAAVITVAMQLAPEIYKAIDYLIKNGEIDVHQIKQTGVKSISTGAEGFLRGSVACSLQIICEKGTLGAALQSVDATMIGAIVAIVMETVKNSILVAAGKITATQMGSAFANSLVVTSGFLVGAKVGAKVGGIIGQTLGFELPVVGYLLGSMIGCAFAVIYDIGKKKLISFCIDTGFTCFGLVEQNYELPNDLLAQIGIDTIPVSHAQIAHATIENAIPVTPVQHTDYETINITMLRRGVIGINKVGYAL